MEILNNLTPSYIDKIYKKHLIEPISYDPWIKGITGGSDDHAGIFSGRTYTKTQGSSIKDFLEQLKCKNTFAEGRHNEYKSFAFQIYKIAYDFSKSKSIKTKNSPINTFNTLFFDTNTTMIKNLKIYKLLNFNKKNKSALEISFVDIIELISKNKTLSPENKFKLAYDKIAELTDDLLKILMNSLENNIKNGNIGKILRDTSAFFPCIFLTIPFFSSLKHMFKGRELINTLKLQISVKKSETIKKYLCFTDTLSKADEIVKSIKKDTS